MTLLTGLLLWIIAQQSASNIETKIVQPQGSGITLVGLPCGDEAERHRPAEPGYEAVESLSRSFVCDRFACDIGVRIKPGQKISSFSIATAMLHDRARMSSAVGPMMPATSLHACGGESYTRVSFSRSDWPVVSGIIFVSGVKYEDGFVWRADADAVMNAAFRDSLPTPRPPQ